MTNRKFLMTLASVATGLVLLGCPTKQLRAQTSQAPNSVAPGGPVTNTPPTVGVETGATTGTGSTADTSGSTTTNMGSYPGMATAPGTTTAPGFDAGTGTATPPGTGAVVRPPTYNDTSSALNNAPGTNPTVDELNRPASNLGQSGPYGGTGGTGGNVGAGTGGYGSTGAGTTAGASPLPSPSASPR